jgi:hypothetical protein
VQRTWKGPVCTLPAGAGMAGMVRVRAALLVNGAGLCSVTVVQYAVVLRMNIRTLEQVSRFMIAKRQKGYLILNQQSRNQKCSTIMRKTMCTLDSNQDE